ncbi:hypothetical protein HYFRA_00009672 [Hymenoscyphus fraxineus]|uniref:Cytochrome P450 n=1 Tax=Hymenoscyphus fraxineus TaxID=746836 RepID=A0A9N9PMN9_9HELO|nr:hypothetical protein HYFRA_00009672 [Hymenoscyphus fraxineus]
MFGHHIDPGCIIYGYRKGTKVPARRISMPQLSHEFAVRSLAPLEYLHAVIEETLRIYPPGPRGIPRIVGSGGDYICGDWVPEGTSIYVRHCAVYHDPKNFTLPEDFIPEHFSPNRLSDSQ